MPRRVNTWDVRAIIAVDDDVACEPFILTATTTIDALLLASGLSDTELFEIERYLAAHFVAQRYPAATEVGTGPYRVKLESGGTGEGYRSTRYGQTALALDRTGTLARNAQGARPMSFDVL